MPGLISYQYVFYVRKVHTLCWDGVLREAIASPSGRVWLVEPHEKRVVFGDERTRESVNWFEVREVFR